jgi:hypothetical protein
MVGPDTGRVAPAIHDPTTVFTRHDILVVVTLSLAGMPAGSRDNAEFVGVPAGYPFKETTHAHDVRRWTEAASAVLSRIDIEIDYLRITNGNW